MTEITTGKVVTQAGESARKLLNDVSVLADLPAVAVHAFRQSDMVHSQVCAMGRPASYEEVLISLEALYAYDQEGLLCFYCQACFRVSDFDGGSTTPLRALHSEMLIIDEFYNKIMNNHDAPSSFAELKAAYHECEIDLMRLPELNDSSVMIKRLRRAYDAAKSFKESLSCLARTQRFKESAVRFCEDALERATRAGTYGSGRNRKFEKYCPETSEHTLSRLLSAPDLSFSARTESYFLGLCWPDVGRVSCLPHPVFLYCSYHNWYEGPSVSVSGEVSVGVLEMVSAFYSDGLLLDEAYESALAI